MPLQGQGQGLKTVARPQADSIRWRRADYTEGGVEAEAEATAKAGAVGGGAAARRRWRSLPASCSVKSCIKIEFRISSP
jgi:hypothetical protein